MILCPFKDAQDGVIELKRNQHSENHAEQHPTECLLRGIDYRAENRLGSGLFD
jgi:hypothetical protein